MSFFSWFKRDFKSEDPRSLVMPYNWWTRTDISKAINGHRRVKKLPVTRHIDDLGFLHIDSLRKKFLRCVGKKDGKDVYALDFEKVEALTDEYCNELIQMERYGYIKLPPRYLVRYSYGYKKNGEYFSKYIQEEVDIIQEPYCPPYFIGKDGYRHIFYGDWAAKIIKVIRE